ncbi:MAG: hypothetical protein CVU81_01195 [Euryarchaeota archaeon HGW-Euryarchaeota-1]|nr:MAG: hypothetical protein CVU81_01195 [Euryarchaeota archaeon HGW-Euryarchaeota-1]
MGIIKSFIKKNKGIIGGVVFFTCLFALVFFFIAIAEAVMPYDKEATFNHTLQTANFIFGLNATEKDIVLRMSDMSEREQPIAGYFMVSRQKGAPSEIVVREGLKKSDYEWTVSHEFFHFVNSQICYDSPTKIGYSQKAYYTYELYTAGNYEGGAFEEANAEAYSLYVNSWDTKLFRTHSFFSDWREGGYDCLTSQIGFWKYDCLGEYFKKYSCSNFQNTNNLVKYCGIDKEKYLKCINTTKGKIQK